MGSIFLLCLIGAVAINDGGELADLANLIGPTLLMVALAWGVVRLLRMSQAVIWTPVLWCRIALIVFYGAGSLVTQLTNEETSTMLRAFFEYFPADVAKYNAISYVFSFTLLLGLKVSAATSSGRSDSGKKDWNISPLGFSLKFFTIVLLVIGSLAKYVGLTPILIGSDDYQIPQVLTQIALLTFPAYYLMTRIGLAEQPWYFTIALLLAFIDAAFGLLTLSKSNALFPLVMVGIGVVEAKPTWPRIFIVLLLLGGTYQIISPLNAYAREELGRTTGEYNSSTMRERIEVLASYTPEHANQLKTNNIQLGWARLSYVNAGTLAITEYDAGRPGNSLRYAAMALIPRFIWPDKPSITSVGQEFTFMANGSTTSQTSPALAPELYWNGGWFAVIGGALFVGALMGLISLYALAVVGRGAWHLLPVVALGMRMAIRMDGTLVSDFIGPLSVIIVAHIILTFLNNLTLKKK